MRYLILFFLSLPVFADCNADRYGDPCPLTVVKYAESPEDHRCTKPLLYDGVCPDYLVGGCALAGGCDVNIKKHDYSVTSKK